jgi:membrane associated rhomboid family serine protease
MGPQQTSGMTPWVRRLIVANLIVFLLQETIFLNPGLPATLGFIPLAAVARPWTAVTYMFVHGNFLHLAFNLLALFVFGRPVEERMGSGPFLVYYLLCGLGGAALSFLLIQVTPVTAAHPIIGASAAVYGVLLAFAWAWPDQPIYVFPLPHPIPAKWLVTFVVALSLLPAIIPGAGAGVAYLAHLGGFATGFLYLKTADWRLGRAEQQLRRAAAPSVLVHPGRAARASEVVKPRATARTPAQTEVDRVLDKISARGIESLTPAERRFLSEMSRKMRDKT